jgi:SOS-response transcriptional repressor LexA
MVKNSGYTLKEIVDRCKLYGVDIDPSYISKLQSGKQRHPASDEVNIALAKACKTDPEELQYEAYMEKAPELIKNFIESLLDYLRNFTKSVLLAQVPKDVAYLVEEKFSEVSDLELIREVVNENPFDTMEHKDNTFVMPDYKDQDSTVIINPIFGLTMEDNSMSPIIPEGARIQLGEPSEVNDGDIVVAVLSDKNYLIRRYVPIDEKIVLIAENSFFKPQTLDRDSVIIAAKVKSYIKDL